MTFLPPLQRWKWMCLDPGICENTFETKIGILSTQRKKKCEIN